MVTIRNKFMVLAAIFWLVGIILIVLGAYGRSAGWDATPTLFTTGILAQATGFGFLGYVIMQTVFSKKK
ncbi:hypothetical protein [Spirosoma luteum]|uniref:hypothetical protein n=1 Tax=Spirosoma luteum TaxID=431553 RepID=UPI000363D3BE|nr:hypothetical protein [Spirosoma luteum]